MNVIKRLTDRLPFPVIFVLGIICASAWIIKQYYGWQDYQNIFHHRGFIGILILCIFSLITYYLIVFILKFMKLRRTLSFSDGFVIAVSDFVGKPELGSAIADEIEEILLSKIREDKLNIRVLEGVIKTPINGPIDAEEIAKQNSINLIVWGKLIDYGNNNVKLIPKMYVANPIKDLELRGRHLDSKIINPSDISLREESAIDSAQFVALVFGVLNFNQGKYDEAIKIFSSITNKYEAEANFYSGLCYYLKSSSLWEKTIDHMKKAVELYQDFGIAYLDLGMICMDVGLLNRAYESFIKAEDIGKRRENLELLSGSNSGLGLYYMHKSNYTKAESYFQSSLEGYKALNNKESTANQYGNLALAKLRLHELEKAKELLEKALPIHRELKSWLGEANDLSNLGLVYQEMESYDEALSHQERALSIYEDHKFNKGIAMALKNIGINYSRQTDYDSADICFREELKILEEIGDKSGKADVLERLGEIQLLQKKSSNAEPYFEEALALYIQIGSKKGEARMYSRLALLKYAFGEMDIARSYFNISSKISTEIGDTEFLKEKVTVLLDLATSQSTVNDYDKAIETLEWAMEISKQINDYFLIGKIFTYLGKAYEGKGDPRRAIEHYKKALSINKEVYGEKHPDVARNLSNLGSAWYYLGELEKALGYFEQALLIAREVHGEKHPDVAADLNKLGVAWYYFGDPRKALGYFEQALLIAREVHREKHPDVAIYLHNVGVFWHALGDPRKALGYIQQAYDIFLEFQGHNHPFTKDTKKLLDILNGKN